MEREMKFQCDTNEDVKRKAIEEGFKQVKKKRQKDTYFIVGETKDSCKTYLRIRQDLISNKSSLDYHKVVSDLETDEQEVAISDAVIGIGIFKELGYEVKCVVEKKRVELQKQPFLLVFDEIKCLGSFIEIEFSDESVNSEEVEQKILALAKHFNINLSKRVTGKGYPELIIEKQVGSNATN